MMVHRWRVTRTEPIAECRVFDVRREECEHPESGRRAGFFVLSAPDWINVMAVTRDERFVLVKQYRHGTKRFTLEVPGGMVDPGETPLEAAKRELLEESGYAAREWIPLGAVEPNPAILDNRCHTFLAVDAERVAAPRPEGNEELELVLRPVADIPDLVREGTIRHALVVCAFHAYGLFRDRR
jgi:8-oxo-dGTP pyrophosphatase MutT (NUDIX family)